MTDKTDIVVRLRDREAIALAGLFYCGPLMFEAATEITSLRERVKELEQPL